MKMLTDTTILVAEDERPVRMLLRVVLEAAGARVIEAENGEVAMRLLDLHPDVDLLCTDVNMPVLDGAELVRIARIRRPDLPVVTCSAIDLHSTYPDLLHRTDAVVRKPFVPSELIQTIDSTLLRHRRDDAVAAS